jgi:Family of unknown function (DUF5317)
MTLVLVVIGLATGVALLLGGRPRRLLAMPLRRRRLLLTATGALALGFAVSTLWPPALVLGLVSAAGLAAYWCALNRRVPGLPLVGTGLALDALVLAVNGSMPVSLAAAQRAGSELTAAELLASPSREVLDDATLLPFLGDVLPFAWPVAPQVVSVGDVLVAAGCGLLLVRTLCSASDRAHEPEALPAHETIDVGATAPGPLDDTADAPATPVVPDVASTRGASR